MGVWVRSATSTIDAADNATSSGSLPFAIIPGLALTNLSANSPPPQVVGTTITFTAGASGGVMPYQYKWWVSNGTSWSVVQDWSTSNMFGWTPSAANVNYGVGVWVRSATSTTDAADNATSSGSISFGAIPALAVTSLSANLPPPQVVGTTTTFTASASGGVMPYQYKWRVSNGTSWSVGQDWSTSNMFGWTPAVANANYSVGVWVRSATSTTDTADNAASGSNLPFAIVSGVTLTSLTADKSAPQPPGAHITFTATASDGTTPYQYKWWLFDGTAWTVMQEWSTSNIFTWSPTTPNPKYQMLVRVQSARNPADNVGLSMLFPISGWSTRKGGGKK